MAIVSCPKCNSQLEVKVSFASGPRESQQQKESPQYGDKGDPRELRELLSNVDDQSMNDYEYKLVKDLRERLEKYGDKTYVSEKQINVIKRIIEKGF